MKIPKKLLVWYEKKGRHHLPWRQTADPYHIYLSEVMLQQTQVTTVLERFYFPFLKKFPTLETLGSASIDEVLKSWEGLGYYSRAKNLHHTAQEIKALPQTIGSLMALKGIGKNTAHAIASFAFGQPVPIMEANIKRILCRLYQLTTPKDKELWELAYVLVDKQNTFDYNQAMMDLGSMVCTPKNPTCSCCPLESICQGKKTPTLYPTKIKKIVPVREEKRIIYFYNNKLSLVKRKGKFLHGLWGFETVTITPCSSVKLGTVTQTYTHFKLIAEVSLVYEVEALQNDYFSPQEIEKIAISKVDEKILNLFLLQL